VLGRPDVSEEVRKMEINGMAHVMLTASNFEASRAFYQKLLPFLGLKPVI